MTTRPPASRYLRLPVVIGVFALIAVACGSNATSISAERVASPAASPAETSPASAPSAAAAPEAAPPAETGHQYGTSIDDWVESSPESASGQASADDPNQSDTPTVEWDDLIPPGFSGQEIVARYEARLDAAEPGSAESNAIYDEMIAEFDPEAVNADLDGQRIRLAGFVAPLTFDGDLVTEFLLVPTFGACIHVPPPPPNQTIMVTVDQSSDGLTTDDSWGAVWVEGTITVAAAQTELASASYTITNATSGVYNDF